MYARIVEFAPRAEKKEEVINVVRKDVLPILKRQPGFLEFLPFMPESTTDQVIAVTLWTEKHDAERYQREVYPKVEGILKPYLATPVTLKHYNVETTLCQHFAEALWSEI
ncbi:MAG: antibiotic biosynthesis monooxygenase family protein [Terriglobales bacterium]|jgi:heme-degrading monooxygenase HmoA